MDDRLRKSVRILTTWLGQIIREQEGDALFEKVEAVRILCRDYRRAPSEEKVREIQEFIRAVPESQIPSLTRAFTLYFQLVNLAEDNHRIHKILSHEMEGVEPEQMSLRAIFQELKEKGISSAKLKKALEQLSIQPVLTAHPTEAKRRSILRQLIRIAPIFERYYRPDLTRHEAQEHEAMILEILEALWQTKEVRDRKLTVEDEITNTLFFFGHTIFSTLVEFHEIFEDSLRSVYPELSVPPQALSFGSWVGGDRDGNPFVKPETSRHALHRHRSLILEHYRSAVRGLIGLLSMTPADKNVLKELKSSLDKDLKVLPEVEKRLSRAEPDETYRRKLSCVMRRLELTDQEDERGYRSSREFADDLELIAKSLRQNKGQRTAGGELKRLILQNKVFGFHLARLDFRQHVDKIRQAAREMIGFWPEAHEWPEIFSHPKPAPAELSEASRQTFHEFETMRELQDQYGPSAADHYIVSMTQDATDLWAVLYLARQAGLISKSKSGRWVHRLDVVPLFETVPDLTRSAEIMETLWRQPLYRTLLKARGNFQEIMLGYSDSNKWGGYLSANFHLYKAQKALARLAEKSRVKLRFFHGKGGSIDRGGGPAHRAVLAAKDSATGFRLRITEQGEVISLKYGHPVIARRNFEQMTSAVLLAGLHAPGREVSKSELERYEAAMQELSDISISQYRNLVYETVSFKTYFTQATPIDVLEKLRIASRPTFRTGIRSIDELRAIPWVFSWTQARHLLSAWFGIGSALKEYGNRHGEKGEKFLRRMYRRWPFFSSILDNAQVSLAKTDIEMARRYSLLVEDEAAREEIFGRIEEEYRTSVRELLSVCEQKVLLENTPVLYESIQLRNPYIDALNAIQLEYLRLWRREKISEEERDRALQVLLLTINGIAFGMKSTG